MGKFRNKAVVKIYFGKKTAKPVEKVSYCSYPVVFCHMSARLKKRQLHYIIKQQRGSSKANWTDNFFCFEEMGFCSLFLCGHGSNRKKGRSMVAWRIFSLKELQAATNNFNYDNKLGEGGFGSVYWGQLWDGSQIAVKRLKVWNDRAEVEFSAEIEVVGRVRHKNLLNLRGYCAEGQERLIVSDYMPNSSLLSHLHRHNSAECLLTWEMRMNIAIGAAEGIEYLHSVSPHIIHRDIKASNVLLDSEFRARVADFGFARLMPDGASHVTTRVKGTLGYLAPEYAMLGKVSESCDVYSFGIVLLELVTGKKPVTHLNMTGTHTIVEWSLSMAARRRFREVVDPNLMGRVKEEEVSRLVLVGLACSRNEAERRPTMTEVVRLLKGESGEDEERILQVSENDIFREENNA